MANMSLQQYRSWTNPPNKGHMQLAPSWNGTFLPCIQRISELENQKSNQQNSSNKPQLNLFTSAMKTQIQMKNEEHRGRAVLQDDFEEQAKEMTTARLTKASWLRVPDVAVLGWGLSSKVEITWSFRVGGGHLGIGGRMPCCRVMSCSSWRFFLGVRLRRLCCSTLTLRFVRLKVSGLDHLSAFNERERLGNRLFPRPPRGSANAQAYGVVHISILFPTVFLV